MADRTRTERAQFSTIETQRTPMTTDTSAASTKYRTLDLSLISAR